MNFKQLIQDYFTFSRNERKGITILLVIIFILAIANKMIFFFETPGRIDPVLFDSARNELGLLNDSVNRQHIDSVDNSKVPPVSLPKTELFPFDPNKATDDEFLKLGLSVKQIQTIRNYQQKGGSFKNREDFFRIWGLSDNQKKRLADWIRIEIPEPVYALEKATVPDFEIELNSADSILLKALPGIGDKLSKRIVKYRDLLGGFYSLNQLKEVYGLSEQTIGLIGNQITLDAKKIRKIDLNFADLYELSKHPYLQKNLAKRIVEYRTKHGKIQDLTVLRDSMILNIDEYNRIKPYY